MSKFSIGDVVVYKSKERGVVTSFNDLFVFVRYGDELHSKATRRKDLSKEDDRDE